MWLRWMVFPSSSVSERVFCGVGIRFDHLSGSISPKSGHPTPQGKLFAIQYVDDHIGVLRYCGIECWFHRRKRELISIVRTIDFRNCVLHEHRSMGAENEFGAKK